MPDFFLRLLNIIFPVTCVVCGSCLPHDDKLRVCKSCFGGIKFIEKRCLKCGKPLLYGGAHCRDCLKTKTRHSFELLRSACLYKGTMRRLLHLFKYSGKEYLGDTLGDLLVGYIRGNTDFPVAEIEKVVPVPLHWTRKFTRGYNQAEILSRIVAEAFDKELVLNLGYRRKMTRPQFRLSKEKRQENMKGAFGTRGNSSMKNNTVMIIDDICTTGSTIEEFSRTMKKAGAKKVYGLTVARG